MSKFDRDENDRLKEENKRLQEKIVKLQGELDRLRSDTGTASAKDEISMLWYSRYQFSYLMASKSYPIYSSRLIRNTSAWGFASKGLKYFRRFRLLSIILRWITKIVVLAESGFAHVASLSVFLVALPFLILFAIFSLTAALFRRRNALKEFKKRLNNKRCYILFASREQIKRKNSQNGFFYSNAKNLASDGSSVIIVSPFFFSKKGFEKTDFYVTAREENENIYLVRKIFFFILRRKIIEKVTSEQITIF